MVPAWQNSHAFQRDRMKWLIQLWKIEWWRSTKASFVAAINQTSMRGQYWLTVRQEWLSKLLVLKKEFCSQRRLYMCSRSEHFPFSYIQLINASHENSHEGTQLSQSQQKSSLWGRNGNSHIKKLNNFNRRAPLTGVTSGRLRINSVGPHWLSCPQVAALNVRHTAFNPHTRNKISQIGTFVRNATMRQRRGLLDKGTTGTMRTNLCTKTAHVVPHISLTCSSSQYMVHHSL